MTKIKYLGFTLIIIGLIGSLLTVPVFNQYELHQMNPSFPAQMEITEQLAPISLSIQIICLFSIPVGMAFLTRKHLAQIGIIIFGSALIFLRLGGQIGRVTLNGTIFNVSQAYGSWAFLLWPLEITAIMGIIVGGVFLLKAFGDWLKKEELIRQK